MNTKTQKALVELCSAILRYARYNPSGGSGELEEAASVAKRALNSDETVAETGTNENEH